MRSFAFTSAAVSLLVTTASYGDIVFRNSLDNGYFVPFTSSTPAAVRYGDSGWFGTGGDSPVALDSITLGFALAGSTRTGSTDLAFTFNDGDPSGLVFGTAAQLYSTTIHLTLPNASESLGLAYFEVNIPLPGVSTLGGFNNVGWSVGVSNFDSDGALGFQCSSAFGQVNGFYTNNASYFNGTSWSQFSFGSGPYGVANFVAIIESVPAPHTAVFTLAGLALIPRRRRAMPPGASMRS